MNPGIVIFLSVVWSHIPAWQVGVESILQFLRVASMGWDLAQAVESMAWLFLWWLRRAAAAELSAQRELDVLRETLRQGKDMMMLSTMSDSDLSGKLDKLYASPSLGLWGESVDEKNKWRSDGKHLRP